MRSLPNWDKYAKLRQQDTSSVDGDEVIWEQLRRRSAAIVDLMRGMLNLDSKLRMSTVSVLEHAYFSEEPLPCQPSEINFNPDMSCHELETKRHHERLQEARRKQAASRSSTAVPTGTVATRARSRTPPERTAVGHEVASLVSVAADANMATVRGRSRTPSRRKLVQYHLASQSATDDTGARGRSRTPPRRLSCGACSTSRDAGSARARSRTPRRASTALV
eukprot:TRINITY_DN27752_c0_g1_i2.p1 TRINITY_DN27752_c0_g1~~TRINITY_DN27752_c0_g1_i2.p1  ORF type:complete len:221 (-),score=25.64 TRINITY_DN27752_c0_g1_i2:47-709(-)